MAILNPLPHKSGDANLFLAPLEFQGGMPPSVAGLLPEKGWQGAERAWEKVFPSKVVRAKIGVA